MVKKRGQRPTLGRKGTTKRVYLDYAAATPIRREVLRAMRPYLEGNFGNASAIHMEGQKARDAIEASRATIATLLAVKKHEVYFTSGGTESNNLAIGGLLEALKARGESLDTKEVITTALEHPSVLGVLERYKKEGLKICSVPVTSEGLIDIKAFSALVSKRTVLVTLAYANSEIGVVQDVKALTRIVRAHRASTTSAFPYFHLDASQAPLYLPIEQNRLGVDMMTLDLAKCYGPKGVGVLMKKDAVPLCALHGGGEQEEGLRPGTEHTAVIVGAGEALRIAISGQEKRTLRVRTIRDFAFAEIQKNFPGALINGSKEERIANNVNFSLHGIDGEYAAVVLDHYGFSVSTKSACSGATGSGSKVVYALGGDDARALSTLRVTLGEETTKRNISDLIRVLKRHVNDMCTLSREGK